MQDAAATPTAVGVPGIDPSATAHLGGTIPGNPEIQLVKVVEGFGTPTNIAFPPDDSGRIFVVSLDGRVHIINPDGNVEPEPFLDLTQVVSGRPGQQGLLGLAFHPKFAENGKFYVDYNDLYDNGAVTISEFTIDAENPNQADTKSERPLLVIEKRSPLHNGGTLRFGQDGYLYISVGDGGWQGDVWDNAQNRFTLLGKILRIDVDRVGPAQPYGIPADNPFAGLWRSDNPYPGQPPAAETDEDDKKGKKKRDRDWPGYVAPEYRNSLPPVRAEIWALGFRNPWQYAFDPANGDLYITDVGADTWEEINYQPAGSQAGQNYGWDWLEGTHCYPAEIESCPRQQVGILPIAEYEHGIDGCAAIAIGVSRAPEDPTLDGIFFSADFCTGEIRGLVRDEAGVWQFANMLDTALQITGSGQDDHGNVFVAATTGEVGDEAPGSVWQLMSADRVPEGAETVPLGQPRQGDIVVDGDGDFTGEPTDAVPGEEGAAAEAGEATPVAEAPQAANGSMPTETIGMYDIYFEPRRIIIPANTDVRLILENKGEAPHSFDVKDQDILVDVEPHTTAEVVVNLPPGNYKFICDVPGHKQVGMNGALVVE
jgi:glucose/arabinose dehydrogenase/uncharacterized cupredoxin-like copper-binding protein